MWSNGATTSTIENLPFGSYEVKVTDANGCMETITVVIDPNCTISVQLFPTEISCRGNDGNLVAEASRNKGTVTYTWSNGQTGRSIIGLAPGTYSVTATDAAGCTAISSYTLRDNQIFLGDSSTDNNSNDGNNSGNDTSGNNGTTADMGEIIITSVSCHGGSDGQISVIAEGGTGSGFTYTWNTGQTGQTIANLSAGTYTVTVADAATGCSITRDITVSEPDPIVVTANVINASDENTADGSATLQVTGGTPPFIYSWNTGATTPFIQNVPAGAYSVKVTDANGCMETITVVIDPNCTISVQLFPTEISCRGNDGNLIAEAARNKGTVTYTWSNGQTGRSIIELAPGTYDVTATDAAGCTATSSYTLKDNQIFVGDSASDNNSSDGNDSGSGNDSGNNTSSNDGTTADMGTILITPVSCHGGSDGQISVIAAGGTGSGFTYTWNTGCLLYTSPSPRDRTRSRMPSSA